jgi:hypothetical protein
MYYIFQKKKKEKEKEKKLGERILNVFSHKEMTSV